MQFHLNYQYFQLIQTPARSIYTIQNVKCFRTVMVCSLSANRNILLYIPTMHVGILIETKISGEFGPGPDLFHKTLQTSEY